MVPALCPWQNDLVGLLLVTRKDFLKDSQTFILMPQKRLPPGFQGNRQILSPFIFLMLEMVFWVFVLWIK